MEQAVVVNTPDGIRFAQLLSVRGMIRLEKLGMKHSCGRSVRKIWALHYGLKQNAKADLVLAKIQNDLDKLMADRMNECRS